MASNAVGVVYHRNQEETRLDNLAQSLPEEVFIPIELKLEKPKTEWVATLEVEVSRLKGKRIIAIVMNASTFSSASEIDYLITNVDSSKATDE
jgi:hypothetical protein